MRKDILGCQTCGSCVTIAEIGVCRHSRLMICVNTGIGHHILPLKIVNGMFALRAVLGAREESMEMGGKLNITILSVLTVEQRWTRWKHDT